MLIKLKVYIIIVSLYFLRTMFNKNKKRNYRSRKPVQEEENEDVTGSNGGEEDEVALSLQERKELQSFRKRQTGVSAESLLAGEKIQLKKEVFVFSIFIM